MREMNLINVKDIYVNDLHYMNVLIISKNNYIDYINDCYYFIYILN